MIRIWSIYDKDYRLVLTVSDEPGIFNFTKVPDDDVDPVDCGFATIQCYDLHVEPEALNLIGRAVDLEDFLDQLRNRGFKVIEGRPNPRKFARL